METLCVRQDEAKGREESVGRLPEPQVPNDKEEEPYTIFLSHTGRDKAKEELARPTHFFLKHILKVKAFLDDGEMPWGHTTDEGLARAAYQCTHALVIISPSFRQRRYCVKELNTFLHRFHRSQQQKDSFQLLAALWKMDNLKGYPDNLNRISWLSHKTENAVYYMLQTLWPRLIQALNLPRKTERELREHFISYLDHQLGDPHLAPNDFYKYVKDQGYRLFLSTKDRIDRSMGSLRVPELGRKGKSDDTAPACDDSHIIVGISFLNIDMDDNLPWNAKVLQRKESIEQKLALIARYGEVIYGRTTMSQARKGLLGWFGFGAAVVRLECEIKLEGHLDQDDYLVVRRAAIAIAKLLEGAGTSKRDLNQVMIGTLWKGSLFLLLEAPEPILERLYELAVLHGDNVLDVDGTAEFRLTGMAPAFTIRVQIVDHSYFPFPNLETAHELQLWRDDATFAGLRVLLPSSLAARGKVLSCGIPIVRWQNEPAVARSLLQTWQGIQDSIIGNRILAEYCHDLHYVIGCSDFDPTGHNVIFNELAYQHFMSKGVTYLNGKCRVQGEVAALIQQANAKAKDLMKTGVSKFRFWHSPNVTLNQNNWQASEFEEISDNLVDLQTHLQSLLQMSFDEARCRFGEQGHLPKLDKLDVGDVSLPASGMSMAEVGAVAQNQIHSPLQQVSCTVPSVFLSSQPPIPPMPILAPLSTEAGHFATVLSNRFLPERPTPWRRPPQPPHVHSTKVAPNTLPTPTTQIPNSQLPLPPSSLNSLSIGASSTAMMSVDSDAKEASNLDTPILDGTTNDRVPVLSESDGTMLTLGSTSSKHGMDGNTLVTPTTSISVQLSDSAASNSTSNTVNNNNTMNSLADTAQNMLSISDASSTDGIIAYPGQAISSSQGSASFPLNLHRNAGSSSLAAANQHQQLQGILTYDFFRPPPNLRKDVKLPPRLS